VGGGAFVTRRAPLTPPPELANALMAATLSRSERKQMTGTLSRFELSPARLSGGRRDAVRAARSAWVKQMCDAWRTPSRDAAEAYQIGLVQEVVPAGQRVDRAIELASRIAAQAPLGVRATLASSRPGRPVRRAVAARRRP
jgi:hypothetical protein